MDRKKPKINVKSNGPEGNIYHLLGLCSQALRKERRIIDFNELRDKVFKSKNYDEAVKHIKEHVDIVDKDNNI